MKRIAVISDIHGNIPALTAVLADIEQRNIRQIICLGDLVGKGPSSAEAVDLTQKHWDQAILGNWDHAIANEASNHTIWHREALGEVRIAYLKELPMYLEFYMSGKLIRLCHASPNDLLHRTFLSSEKADRMKLFEPTPTMNTFADVVGYGDIHGAHIESFEGKIIFNAGSVGNPLEITQASYAILDGEYEGREIAPFTIALARVPYDIEAAVEQALASDMPDKEAYIRELRTAIYRGRKG